MSNNIFLVGIDEAGRGPIAGPVAVGVCMIEKKFKREIIQIFKGLTDSKEHNQKEREFWYKVLTREKANGLVKFEVGFSSARIIDKKGIMFAINRALSKALNKLLIKDKDLCEVVLDGSLKAPAEFKFQETIIRGDKTEKIISMASIVAKVERDGLMRKLSRKYPEYAFDIHKGYGTVRHFELIDKYGVSEAHRLSFLLKRGLVKKI